jgi:hypothetical protein
MIVGRQKLGGQRIEFLPEPQAFPPELTKLEVLGNRQRAIVLGNGEADESLTRVDEDIGHPAQIVQHPAENVRSLQRFLIHTPFVENGRLSGAVSPVTGSEADCWAGKGSASVSRQPPLRWDRSVAEGSQLTAQLQVEPG